MLSTLLKEQARAKEKRTIFIAILLIVVVVALGSFSMARLSKLHTIVTTIQAQHVTNLRTLNDISAMSERLRNLQSLTLLTKESLLREGVEKRKASVKEARKQAWDKYLSAIEADAEEKKTFTPVMQAWDKYSDLSAEALSLQKKGAEAKAIKLFNTEAQQAMEAYREAMIEYRGHLTEQVQKTVEKADKLYSESRVVLLGVFLFAVPMALLMGASIAFPWL